MGDPFLNHIAFTQRTFDSFYYNFFELDKMTRVVYIIHDSCHH